MARLIDADDLTKTLKSFLDLPNIGYMMGIERAIQLTASMPTVPAYWRWISVEEKWPQNNQEVLVYEADGYMCCGVYYDAVGFTLDSYHEGQKPITHWAPMPEPPENESAPKAKTYSDTIGDISMNTGLEANIRQLIEEAAELIVACNKYLRSTGSGQPTPITTEEAIAMIEEEMADVEITGDVIKKQMAEDFSAEIKSCKSVKADRWIRRLVEEKEVDASETERED